MNTVRFVMREKVCDVVDRKDRFEFRPDKKWHSLQKVCLWALDKLGAWSPIEDVSFRTVEINPDTFMNRLFEQYSYLQQQFNLKPKVILIGAKNYALMMGEVMLENPVAFDASYSYAERGNVTVYGLKVKVIPWMEGIVVMPKEYT